MPMPTSSLRELFAQSARKQAIMTSVIALPVAGLAIAGAVAAAPTLDTVAGMGLIMLSGPIGALGGLMVSDTVCNKLSNLRNHKKPQM